MKNTYYYFGENRILTSSIRLIEEEAIDRDDITNIIPPKESYEQAAKFTGAEWILINRQITPTLNKLSLIGNAIDEIQITNLPEMYTLEFDGVEHESSDSTCEISVDTPGEYTLRISSSQLLDFVTQIVAT